MSLAGVALAALTCLLCPVKAHALELRSRHIGIQDGLPNNSIRHFYQDRKGFIWMSTLNGLTRYDGNTFVNYMPGSGQEPCLSDHRIRQVHEDKNGFLWINTYSKHFSCYDLKHGRFVDYTGKGLFRALEYNKMAEAGGSVWLWGNSDGCMRVAFKDGKFASVVYSKKANTLPTNNIQDVIRGNGDDVYIAAVNGLYVWHNGKITVLSRKLSLSACFRHKNSLVIVDSRGGVWLTDFSERDLVKLGDMPVGGPAGAVQGVINVRNMLVAYTSGSAFGFDLGAREACAVPEELNVKGAFVSEDNKNNYWLRNKTGMLRYVNSRTGCVKTFDLMPKNNPEYLLREHYSIVEDTLGVIWIATFGNGLFTYDRATGTLQHYLAEDSGSPIAGSNFLQAIMPDRSGSVWVSTEFSGIFHIRMVNKNASRLFPEGTNNSNLNIVRMLRRDGANVWLGTRRGSFFRYDTSLSEKTLMPQQGEAVYSVMRDKQGSLWVGTRNNGLYIDGKQYVQSSADKASVNGNHIYSLLQDRAGRVWVGTFGGGLDLAVKGAKGYTFRHVLSGTGEQRFIRCLIMDRKGHVWAGTSGGLLVFSPDELLSNPRSYRAYTKASGALACNEIRSLMEDSRGRVYVAESGVGFAVCVPQDYDSLRFTHYNTAAGLVNSMVQAFTEDRSGRVWVSTEYGISCFDPRTAAFDNYFFSDNALGDVYCENAAVTLADGRLAFGSNHGLVVVSPERALRSAYIPAVTFTNMKVNGAEVGSADGDSPLGVSLAYEKQVVLRHDQNSFEVEFSTLDFSDENVSKYSYKLENYDDAWSKPSVYNFAAYKNLPHGTYFLHVKACNAAGEWSGREAILKITVRAPWYLTWWAFLLYAAAIAVSGLALAQNARRMSELRNRIKVEKQLTEYKLMFFTNISHEFRTPLTLIQGALERIESARNMPKAMAYPVSIMQRSTARLLRMVNQLIEFRKMQAGKLTLALEQTNVISMLLDIYKDFDEAAKDKGLAYEFASPELAFSMFVDREKLDKVVYNLLSNAIKYTPAGGKVTLEAAADSVSRSFVIKVRDTGIGVPPEKRGQLFTRFMQLNASGNSMGIGLHLTRELVSAHKGDISYEENPGGGSVFTVRLPVDASVYAPDDFLQAVGKPAGCGEARSGRASSGRKNLETEPQGAQETLPEKGPLNRQRVLVVEDEKDVREFIEESLRPYFNVITAQDGASGLEKAQSESPDLIVSDVLMPGCSGFELAKRLKNNFQTSHIPVILLTALCAPEERLEGVESGADAYITKPFSLKFLLANIQKLLQQRQKLREKFTLDPNATHSTISVTTRDKEFAERLKAVIEARLTDPKLSVDDLAASMNMGRSTFYTKVRGVFGYSPNEYIRITKLKAGALMLRNNATMTVAEVAYAVGINDPFYFSRLFKKQFGVSPSVYQRGKDSGGRAAEEAASESGSQVPD